jgi:NADH:ubiquinone oxidoreductase subunit 3 (subunit A)
VFVTLLMNRYLGPQPIASAMKLEPFECGATPVDTRNTKAVPIKYYGVAVAFMLFDLETVFLFIWALGRSRSRDSCCSRSSSSPFCWSSSCCTSTSRACWTW